jgi:hypothetical protein
MTWIECAHAGGHQPQTPTHHFRAPIGLRARDWGEHLIGRMRRLRAGFRWSDPRPSRLLYGENRC